MTGEELTVTARKTKRGKQAKRQYDGEQKEE